MKSPTEKYEERIKWLSLRSFPNGVKKFSETAPSILQESTKTNRQWKFFLASTHVTNALHATMGDRTKKRKNPAG